MKTILAALLVLLVLVGCDRPQPRTRPLFHRGDLVLVRASGERVMVTGSARYHPRPSWPEGWFYRCRIGSARQRHRDGVVSADTEFVAYTEVKFWEFELAPIEGDGD